MKIQGLGPNNISGLPMTRLGSNTRALRHTRNGSRGVDVIPIIGACSFMDMQTLHSFSAVAGIAILGPGPAVMLALRNGATWSAGAIPRSLSYGGIQP
jgi:hypothetical protein